MIAYFDTSSLVPLLVTEAGSAMARRLWDGAEVVVVTRLAHVEASAALAAAERAGRIDASQESAARALLETLWASVVVLELDETLMRAASQLTRNHGLRGYDAVHAAAAVRLGSDDDIVAVSGDRTMLAAWQRIGLVTVNTSAAT
ncbi:hypothetical protein SAMN06264364_10414 [Quadrisphaera granulorum]|uniref:Ribonuclease VapC n=1 Tax=Quadrisphaera granulorum TaxID=317664 RepID=A0A316ABK7_9ACTN|nr:type II toxin-antitoxin system VapC family toxin [Quadrisphaera granulorum]PWJ55093.1 hypothetical protein BXY45_10414 [Quadrisphaera granulorum]SZE95602.1 hypothetical protein SAMN06264364_10414 [Quadrisphaera granulorum]